METVKVWNTVGALFIYVTFAGDPPIYPWVWSACLLLGECKTEGGNLLSPHPIPFPPAGGNIFKACHFPSTRSQETTPYSAQPEKYSDGFQPWKK